jgi:cell division ATPase FtsA
MKFLRGFRRKKQERPSAYSLIDIGRDTVKSVVILTVPGTPELQVIGWGLARADGHDITGGRIEANAVTASVNAAVTQAEDSTERVIGQKIVPDDAIFVLAGRATIGKLFSVRQTRPRPAEPISARELNTLRVRAERLVRQGLAALPVEGGQWQPLAVTDAGIRLDQHLVLDGLGLTGQDIAFSIFGVAGQAATLRALQVLANRLDLTVVNIVASTQALATLTPHTEAVILDTGLSGTDICLIRDNGLVGTAWVPFGGGYFTQALAQAMDIRLDRAVELKHAFAAGTLPQESTDEIEAYLEAPRRRWYDAVMESLLKLSHQTNSRESGPPAEAKPSHLPRRIYLAGGGSLLPGLDKLLRTDPDPFDGVPEINRLGDRPLPGIKDLTDSLDYSLFALTLSLAAGLPER